MAPTYRPSGYPQQPASQGYQGATAQPPGGSFQAPSAQPGKNQAQPGPSVGGWADRDQPQTFGQPANSGMPSQYLQPGLREQSQQAQRQRYQQATMGQSATQPQGQGGPTGGFFQTQPMQQMSWPSDARTALGAPQGSPQQNEGPTGTFSTGTFSGGGQPTMYDTQTPMAGQAGPVYQGGGNFGTGGQPGGLSGGQGGVGGSGQVGAGGGVPANWWNQIAGGGVQFGRPPGPGIGGLLAGQIGTTGIQANPFGSGGIAGGGWMGGPGPGSTGGYPGGSGGAGSGGGTLTGTGGGLPSKFPPPPPGGWPAPIPAPPPPTGGGEPFPGPTIWPNEGPPIPIGGGPGGIPPPAPPPAPPPPPGPGGNYWENPETYQQFQQLLQSVFQRGPGEAQAAPTIGQPDLSQINQLASQGPLPGLTMPQQQAWLQAQQASGPDLSGIQQQIGQTPGGLQTPQGSVVDPNAVLGRIGSFAPGQAPGGYQASQVNTPLPSGQTPYDSQTQQMMQQVFAGAGQGLPVEQLKQQQTEQALAAQQQAQQQMAQQAAARGTLGSGQQQANERRLYADTQANILKSSRDIDIQNALQQQQQRMQAATLGDQLAQGQFGRGSQVAQLGMQQGFGNEALRQQQAQSALQGYQAQTGAQLQGRGQDVQSVLAAFGLGQEGSLANAGLSAQVGLGQRGQDVTTRGQNLDTLMQGQGLASQVGMANAAQANQLGLGQRGQNLDLATQQLQAQLGQRGQDLTGRGQSLDALLAAQNLGLQGNTANAQLQANYNMGTRGQNLDYQQAQNQQLMQSILGMGNLGQQGASIGLERQLGLGNLGVAQQRANQDYTLGQGNLALGQSGQALQQRLAEMQDLTSRYGIDQNTAQLMQQLGFNREQLGLQRELGMGGLDVDRSRITESGRQYDLGNQLGWGNLLNNATLGRLNYGLGLGELQQGGQNQLIQSLFGAL